jgi:hypothetical protein
MRVFYVTGNRSWDNAEYIQMLGMSESERLEVTALNFSTLPPLPFPGELVFHIVTQPRQTRDQAELRRSLRLRLRDATWRRFGATPVRSDEFRRGSPRRSSLPQLRQGLLAKANKKPYISSPFRWGLDGGSFEDI